MLASSLWLDLARLQGIVDALLGCNELGHRLGHMLASSLWLDLARLQGIVDHDRLYLVVAFHCSVSESTAAWRTELSGLLVAGGLWGELLHKLPLQGASLYRPLIAFWFGDVADSDVPALGHELRPAACDVILNFMHLLLCGAFSLINSLAHSLPRNVAILHNWCSANLNCFIVGQWLVADMAHLFKIFFALLFLLRVIVREARGNSGGGL